MESIRSLSHLLDKLPACSGSDYVRIAKNMQIQSSDFSKYAYWSQNCYTRNCITRNENYELILLCWESGQTTPIHCHGGEECWVYMIQGEIEEFRYEGDTAEGRITQVDRMHLKEGKISYMNDEMGFHSLSNIYPGRSMSLHLYMNPINECNIYDEESGEFHLKTLKYHSMEGHLLESTTY